MGIFTALDEFFSLSHSICGYYIPIFDLVQSIPYNHSCFAAASRLHYHATALSALRSINRRLKPRPGKLNGIKPITPFRRHRRLCPPLCKCSNAAI